MNITRRIQKLMSLFLFYSAVSYTRLFSQRVLPEFFSSSANEGMKELVIRLLLTLMVVGSLVIELKFIRKHRGKMETIRFLIRVYLWLFFTNTILYTIYAIPLSDIFLNIIFILGFLFELFLVLYTETKEENINYISPVHHTILFSILILSMFLLTMFQFDGMFGILVHLVVYTGLFISLIILKNKQLIGKRGFILYTLWIVLFLTSMNVLGMMDIVINDVYLFGRLTLRLGLYLLMYLPLYNVVLHKKDGYLL